MPVQGTCQPSVKKSFFFGGSFGSFCSFTFDVVAFGVDLEATVFGCTFNKISVIVLAFNRLISTILYRVSQRFWLFNLLIIPDKSGSHVRHEQMIDLIQHVTLENVIHNFMTWQLRRIHQKLKGKFQTRVHLSSPRFPLAFFSPFLQI